MFKDRVRIKALLIGLLVYMVATILVTGLVIHYWIPPNIADAQEIQRLAESDPTLLAWQSRLGAPVAIVAGFLVTHLSGAKGLRNSLLLGVLLVLYGVFGIYLHPSHSFWMQIGKLISPIPIALLGGWLRLRFVRPELNDA